MNQPQVCEHCQAPMKWSRKGAYYCSAFCGLQGKPCSKCGAEIIYNQQYQKYECSANCWKGGQQANSSGQQNVPYPEQTGSQGKPAPPAPRPPHSQYGASGRQAPAEQKTDWDAINAEKQRNIHWGESFKLAVMLQAGVSTNVDDVYQIALQIYNKLHNDPPWVRKQRTDKHLHRTEANPPPPPDDGLPY